ncbi:hypothetical protein JCM14202_749 [Agrilactobacillus composti DSM 18527 = JCM 14202]|nr:hypothetical protein JCM14202_749 [Agrilactobacillus composti DSM 18527 = JCM 14202]
MIILLAVSLLVGTIWAPETRNKSLDEITEERYGKEYVLEPKKNTTDNNENGASGSDLSSNYQAPNKK